MSHRVSFVRLLDGAGPYGLMAEAGAVVGCADIDEDSAKAAAPAVEGLGRRAAAIGCDVTAEAEVEAIVTRGAALFLASAAPDYMTGQTLVADRGCLAK
jgi:NAD(P)-dependent dehydrogenase (short-subunit alcohol dehydrogenase family)